MREAIALFGGKCMVLLFSMITGTGCRACVAEQPHTVMEALEAPMVATSMRPRPPGEVQRHYATNVDPPEVPQHLDGAEDMSSTFIVHHDAVN
jgi:hypothetical protein